jgi:hypothetical protein
MHGRMHICDNNATLRSAVVLSPGRARDSEYHASWIDHGGSRYPKEVGTRAKIWVTWNAPLGDRLNVSTPMVVKMHLRARLDKGSICFETVPATTNDSDARSQDGSDQHRPEHP